MSSRYLQGHFVLQTSDSVETQRLRRAETGHHCCSAACTWRPAWDDGKVHCHPGTSRDVILCWQFNVGLLLQYWCVWRRWSPHPWCAEQHWQPCNARPCLCFTSMFRYSTKSHQVDVGLVATEAESSWTTSPHSSPTNEKCSSNVKLQVFTVDTEQSDSSIKSKDDYWNKKPRVDCTVINKKAFGLVVSTD